MIVNGSDHDMLMMAYVFSLYGDGNSERAALKTAKDDPEDFESLGGTDVATMLSATGLDVALVSGSPKDVVRAARHFSGAGMTVLIKLLQDDESCEPIWHLVGDVSPDDIATISFHEEDGLVKKGGYIQQFCMGEAVIVMQQVPQWKGSWSALLGV